jgi:hypothetical protein
VHDVTGLWRKRAAGNQKRQVDDDRAAKSHFIARAFLIRN